MTDGCESTNTFWRKREARQLESEVVRLERFYFSVRNGGKIIIIIIIMVRTGKLFSFCQLGLFINYFLARGNALQFVSG